MILSLKQEEIAIQESGLLLELDKVGFCVRHRLAPHMTTIEVAQAIGTVINLEKLLPSGSIPTVQSLRPKKMREVRQNQYSGNYGLGSFPLHTDLAHWAIPPHYFLLRCVVGSNDVFTYVLAWEPIIDLVGPTLLQKAVFCARRRRIGYSGLVRTMTHLNGTDILRWDPIFLKPLNPDARMLASTMRDSTCECGVVSILLNEPGDTLIVDNWRALHGRSEVTPQGMRRRVDRVYLSEVLQ
jgi:hypothetical protein